MGNKDQALSLLNHDCELYDEWGAAASAQALVRFRDSLFCDDNKLQVARTLGISKGGFKNRKVM